jgi:hypothetical protein
MTRGQAAPESFAPQRSSGKAQKPPSPLLAWATIPPRSLRMLLPTPPVLAPRQRCGETGAGDRHRKPPYASNRKRTTFYVGDTPMKPQQRICSMHHRIEVRPGVWQRERLFIRSTRGNSESKEGACPTCVQTARDLFKKQFPQLYAASALSSRQSA